MNAEAARAALDRLIAEPRPCTMDKGRDAFLTIAAWRDALILRRHAGDAVEAELLRANTALSLTWSAVLPVAGFRPGRLEKARAILDDA